ncbi:MAG: UDP-glucose 4-epimerase GalE [Candidatus Latescibacterota bacterium]|nr:UDP-glucose 4-epimerase GalE [Candidatus Latescibacterota bacterium]
MAILVTGGCGYIGSVTVEALRKDCRDVVVIDNLCRGHRQAINPDVPFHQGHVGDVEFVRHVVRKHGVDACVHFAALAYVGESVQQPDAYYDNNVGQSCRLIDSLVAEQVRSFVFSSTCATYGEPERLPLDEGHSQNPENPYGWTKLFVERTLERFAFNYGLGYAALRYFNAAGATATRGEDHDPESHLVPLALQVALGRRDHLTVFGEDYSTHDGTCVRDYIHVSDLAQAHIRALDHLADSGGNLQLNLGTGTGYSVREVVDTAAQVSGKPIELRSGERRDGDASHLVADVRRAREQLGWVADLPELEAIVQSAWDWHRRHPYGYGGGAHV